MSFIRVSEPGTAAVPLEDLGITIALSASNVVLSDQFTMNELIRSAALEAAIQNGDLTVELNYDGWTAVAAIDYTNRDTLGTYANIFEITNEDTNELLVDGSDATTLHMHDSRYYTETELGATTGAALVGADDTNCPNLTFTDVQEGLEQLCGAIDDVDLDQAYDNDSDGILNVDGTTKPLEFRSDNTASNDILITRYDLTDVQNYLLADISADELILGAAAVGGHSQIDVRVLTDLYVDGNITFVGTITDTTVDNLNVTNAEILLRDGAGAGGDAAILVERGVTGDDACVSWNETTDRWEVGLTSAKYLIARANFNEVITGVWNFDTIDDNPNFLLDEKVCATPPTSELGAAGKIPFAVMDDGQLYTYDKTNSRDKWLSVNRDNVVFTGRNTTSNKDEYLWLGRVNSQRVGWRVATDSTLVSIKAQAGTSATYTIRIRKNGAAANLATLVVTAALGDEDLTLDLDLTAGDYVQAYLDTGGVQVEAPVIDVQIAKRCG